MPLSQAQYILMLTALCGELPLSVLPRLPITESYRYKVIADLKNKKLIRLFERDSVKAYRVTVKGKRLLVCKEPKHFCLDENPNRSELKRRLHTHLSAQALVTIQNAGIPLFHDGQSMLFSPESETIRFPVFYTAREVKDIGVESRKIRSSRIAGVLCDRRKIYLVYNTGASIMKWEHRTELRMRSVLDTKLCLNAQCSQYSEHEIIGLMFGDGMDSALQLLNGNGGYRKQGYRPDGSFEMFWFCPNTPEGEAQLSILTAAEYPSIGKLLLSGFARSSNRRIDCDAVDTENRPVLLALDFDMPRLKRFRDALQLFGETGSIYCFDFQVPTMRAYMGALAKIHSVSLQKTKEVISHEKKGT